VGSRKVVQRFCLFGFFGELRGVRCPKNEDFEQKTSVQTLIAKTQYSTSWEL